MAADIVTLPPRGSRADVRLRARARLDDGRHLRRRVQAGRRRCRHGGSCSPVPEPASASTAARDRPINEAHHIGGAAILMCDATIPGRGEGRLDAETLA
jgi:hypothetical protein